MTDPELLRQIHNRLDKQDLFLIEIRDKINAHVVEFDQIRPAMDELVSLWKGSKILLPLMAGAAAMIWGIISWAKEHLR